MSDRRKFKKNDLMDMLKSVSRSLKRPVSCTLIGGLAMMHHGAKESTKDIDLVFNNDNEIHHFINTIKEMGFDRKTALTDDYLDLKAHAIYFSDEGHMLDLFLGRVLDGFYLTDEMIKRSTPIEIDGDMNLSILSPVDIFLFKSITMREGDLLDMIFLAPMIHDWRPLNNEILFMKHDYRLLSRFHDRYKELKYQHQLDVPIAFDIEELCEMAIAKMAILGAIQNEPKSKVFIFERSKKDEEKILEIAIKELVYDGIIHDEDGMVSMKYYSK